MCFYFNIRHKYRSAMSTAGISWNITNESWYLSIEFARPPHVLLLFNYNQVTLIKCEVIVFLCPPWIQRLSLQTRWSTLQRHNSKHVIRNTVFIECQGFETKLPNAKKVQTHEWKCMTIVKLRIGLRQTWPGVGEGPVPVTAVKGDSDAVVNIPPELLSIGNSFLLIYK